jgi:hypothetical protein
LREESWIASALALLAMTAMVSQDAVLEICPASFRKQSRHRQSLPSAGIGSRAVSSAHQQGPARLQENSVPQPLQARRRDSGFSERFVMNRCESRP